MGSSEPFSFSSRSITQCVTLKLTEQNYLLWKTQFESFLAPQLLLGFVNGSETCPPATLTSRTGDVVTETSNPDFLKWYRSDQMVRSWLLGSLSEDVLGYVYHLTTSHEVWTALAKHLNRASSSRQFELQRKLQNISKLNKPMPEYLREFKNICDQLSSIGFPVTEHMKIFGVLRGLGREYDSIITYIEGSMNNYPPPSYESVVSQLTGFDDRLQSYETQTTVSPYQAFAISNGYSQRGRGGFQSRFGSNRGRGSGSFSSRGRGFHQQINSGSHPTQDPDSRPTCQICGRFGHPASKCWHRFDQTFQCEEIPKALAAMKISDPTAYSGAEWYPDTGATTHVTNSPQNLQTTQPYDGSDSVMVGNGDFLPITHVGSISLPTLTGQKDFKASQSGKGA